MFPPCETVNVCGLVLLSMKRMFSSFQSRQDIGHGVATEPDVLQDIGESEAEAQQESG